MGMGKELYLHSKPAREAFDLAEKLTGLEIRRAGFSGPEEFLKMTAICQPAILTFSIACLNTLLAHSKAKDLSIKFAAGLSLGEYPALVAAGALSFEDAIMLVKARAEFMEEEALAHPGKMAAIIGLDREKVQAIALNNAVEVANFNAPGQIVISGAAENIEKAKEAAVAAGARTAVILETSGAFHSSLMKGAAVRFSETLKTAKIVGAQFPVISNVTALPETAPDQIRQNLLTQITSPVRWEESVRYLASQGVTTFLELGPGKILKGLLRRIDPALIVHNLENPADFDTLISAD